MPLPKSIEDELRDYIRARPLAEEKAAERAIDIVRSVNEMRNMMLEHDAEDKIRHAELQSEMRANSKTHSFRIGQLEKKAGKLEQDVDDTGRYELTEFRDHAKWARRTRTSWVLGIIAVLVTSAITGLVTATATRTPSSVIK